MSTCAPVRDSLQFIACVFIMLLEEEEMFKVYDTELTVTV
jgi:hypothetical protein